MSRRARSRPRSDDSAQIYVRTGARRRPGRRVGATVLLALALFALIAALVLGVELLSSSDAKTRSRTPPAATVRVVADGREIATARLARLRQTSKALTSRLPAERTVRRGLARISLTSDVPAARAAIVRAVRAGGGTVALPEHATASSATLPIVKQALRNNCETAALAMLLSARRVQGDQLALQRRLARSRPLDPRIEDGVTVWGDPSQGFVGRPEGGGRAGGYGVHEQPIQRLAERYEVHLRSLTGRHPSAIYRALLRGHPLIAWVGLSDGPYRTWRTPQGRQVTANLGEHTVVLTGLRGDTVAVNDPLTGLRVTWTRAEFELMWERLGRRALSI